ncbi:MAG: class I SAM-dependent methyltransferase [Flavisolibacter sp.]
MNHRAGHINESKVSRAFSRQAPVFDELYGSDEIIRYKRARVRRHLLQFLSPGDHVLELNCGTGEDALFLVEKGFRVHATDVSGAMLYEGIRKLRPGDHRGRVSWERISFSELSFLRQKGPFDHIFSNFGGLNCTGSLDQVLQQFSPLLKPEGGVTLVVISRFCLWEMMLAFRGKFATAFRRFFAKSGRKARVEGMEFNCWYYGPSYIRKQLSPEFELLSVEGLCTIVPPSYLKDFGLKHPVLFGYLKKMEEKWGHRWPWKNIGDYYIISLKKRPGGSAF